MVALTCGFCGTLLTPMAANFNIVPVAMLEMKDKYGVIKKSIADCTFHVNFPNCLYDSIQIKRMIEMKVVVTGFDPFGGEAINPAFEAVKKLPAEIAELKLLKLRCQLFLALVVKKWLKQLKPINQIW